MVLFPVFFFALVLRKNTTCELLGRRLTDPQKCHVFSSSFELNERRVMTTIAVPYTLEAYAVDGRILLEDPSESNESVS